MKNCVLPQCCLFVWLTVLLTTTVVYGSERPITRGYPFGRRRFSLPDDNINSIELASQRPKVIRTTTSSSSSSETNSIPRDILFRETWTSSLDMENLHSPSKTEPTVDLMFVTEQQRALRPAFLPPKEQTNNKKKPRKEPLAVVTSAEELRREILDHHKALKQVRVRVEAQNFTHQALFDHAVVQLIVHRGKERSKPGHRAVNDTSRLALAIEGGGMRGAVSAGMAAALMCLGLSDSFDTIYGSSAGSVIGAYMVSRQLCMDVYVDILPAAKGNFVCLKRLWKSICLDMLHSTLSQRVTTTASPAVTPTSRNDQPGLNTSFILDEIMHPERGVRPLDLKAFLKNNKDQPLHIAATYAENGHLTAHCFGGHDFVSDMGPDNRNGVYACLQASMHVPGAAGAPVRITNEHNHTRAFFDAFCCEPLPYRSAVADGATHCLVLCSRPDGYQPKTKQGIYDSRIAPAYFNAHGEQDLAHFFKRGGQQYIYAEDLLTLMEAQLDRGDGVVVPPPNVLYGVDKLDATAKHLAQHRNEWRRAHLLPIKVPVGTSELPTLEKKRESVLESVREIGRAHV